MSARQDDLKTSERSANAAREASNVEGNARITGSLAAVLFVLLFVEGVTILRVRELISWHVFIGTLLIPFAAAKMASTAYRFARYYSGRSAYVRKGPPATILRLLGPLVTALTVAVLASGVGAVLDRRSPVILLAHKASFVLWFGAMAVHVLGHLLETPALALADWRRSGRVEVRGAPARFAVLAMTAVVGVPLAILSLHYAHLWQHLQSR